MTGKNHLILGDSFLSDEKFQKLLTQFKKQAGGEVSLLSYYLSEKEFFQVLEEARTLPFLASAQFFRLREAHALKAPDLEALENYLKQPTPTTMLCFESTSTDKCKKIQKLMAKHGEVTAVDPRESRGVGGRLIRETLRQYGKTMSPPALRRLESQMAEVPMFLESILHQLIEYVGKAQEITEDMVEAFEEKWVETDVFQLTDALAGRNLSKALSALREIVGEDMSEAISLLGLLHWQMRRFWVAKVYVESGMSQGEVMRKCRVSPRQVPFFTRQLKQFDRKKLESILENLFQLDWKMKTGRVEGPIALESWVVETTT